MTGEVVKNQGGRPRDPSRDAAILSTTFELLTNIGYDRLRVDDIASRSGVGLSTMYRRWPTKEELVAAAINWATAQPAGEQPATIRGCLERIAAGLRNHPAFLPGIVAALRADSALADTIRTRVRQPDQHHLRSLIRERLGPHADSDDVRLIADIGPSVMFTRALIENEPPTNATIDQLDGLIDSILRSQPPTR